MAKGSGTTRNIDKTHRKQSDVASEIHGVISEYINNYNDFFRDISNVVFQNPDNNSIELASIVRDVLYISKGKTGLYIEGKNIDVAKLLSSSLDRIKRGNGDKLSLQEEYALHLLLHEGVHKSEAWKRTLSTTKNQILVHESINEFLTIMNHDTFISRIGGSARYQREILNNYLSYSASDIIEALRKNKIGLNIAAHALQKVHSTISNPKTYKAEVIKTLIDLGMSNAKEVINNL